MLRNRLDIQLRNVCLIFRVYGWLQSLWTPWTPFAPPLEPLEYTAESRDRTGSQHDIQCSEPAAVARGQKCGAGVKSLRTAGYAYCPEICSLAIRSGVGGLIRRLLNKSEKLTSEQQARRQPNLVGAIIHALWRILCASLTFKLSGPNLWSLII